MRRRRRGRFLVLEGLDGAGTTTQAALLAAWLRGRGREVHLTAEPSRGPVGALIRQILSGRIGGGPAGRVDPAALALLFAADRLDHVACEVEPRLAAGCDVVSDRYTLSSLAYQSAATGLGRWVEAANARAPAPDLTVFLAVRPAVALRRRFAASAERELFEVPEFQRRVALAYR
ncbi:MAG TPA: dTMP kinase, partial [Anaeromyxobacteraceae bacterium]